MIVDSTRKGKRFPDSMSKTIPIWTCVLNRAILNYRNRLNGGGTLEDKVGKAIFPRDEEHHLNILFIFCSTCCRMLHYF